jgi:hypothetical protein
MNAKRRAPSRPASKCSKVKLVRDWAKLCIGLTAATVLFVLCFNPPTSMLPTSFCLLLCLIFLGEKTPAQWLAQMLSGLFKKG